MFTDTEDILTFTEGNIRRNYQVIVNNRSMTSSTHKSASDGVDHAELSRSACDTTPLWFGPLDSLPPRVVHLASSSSDLCVLCSECVFRTELHKPLAQTLHALLSLHSLAQTECSGCSSCMVIVGFILREQEDLLFISQACPEHGLTASRVPSSSISSVLQYAPWASMSDKDLLPQNCHLYEIQLCPC